MNKQWSISIDAYGDDDAPIPKKYVVKLGDSSLTFEAKGAAHKSETAVQNYGALIGALNLVLKKRNE